MGGELQYWQANSTLRHLTLYISDIYNRAVTIAANLLAFEWDEGNQGKNWEKHGVSVGEAEEVFFDKHKRLYPDPIHSSKESRKIIIGQTKKKRMLFVVFTVRKKYVRVISARDLNRKERGLYEKSA